jgi:hypothetical protein
MLFASPFGGLGLERARTAAELCAITPTPWKRRSSMQEAAKVLSIILLIRPSRSLPPLEFYSGVRPSQAANWRPDLNCAGSVTDAAMLLPLKFRAGSGY